MRISDWSSDVCSSDLLDKESGDYERLKLEGLWVFQSIDTYDDPLLRSLLEAQSHEVRAGALRALQLWHSHVGNLGAILQKAVKDPHPQVRLEAVIALRELGDAAAAKVALDV